MQEVVYERKPTQVTRFLVQMTCKTTRWDNATKKLISVWDWRTLVSRRFLFTAKHQLNLYAKDYPLRELRIVKETLP